MSDETDRLELPEAIVELSSTMLDGAASMEAVLDHASRVAQRTIPGAAEVSVTVQNGEPKTVASSGKFAVIVDERQYGAGEGPCLDAIQRGEPVAVDDQRKESRWPQYSPQALEAGVGSSYSVPLNAAGRTIGAFNAYATTPGAFDEDSKQTAQNIAAYAGVVLNNASLYFQATSHAAQMNDAMRSRAVIEQAKGILMGARRCGAEEAFDILVRLSQQSHRKLREVAQAVVDESTRPT